jgi:hypothetical protein
MTFLIILGAALCAGIANLFMRICMDAKGTPYGYLTFFYIVSLIASLLLFPIHENFDNINLKMFFVGGTAGVFNIVLMLFLLLALKVGPSGLTFAFQNSGSVLPAVLLFNVFGVAYGFELTNMMILGLLCVILGLFWGALTRGTGDQDPKHSISGSWVFFASMAFLIQGLTLSVFNWRCLLFMDNLPENAMIPFRCSQTDDMWFMPGMFFFACVVQIALFVFTERRLPRKEEILYGTCSGVFNGLSTYLLLLASIYATPTEKGLIFPFFAVAVIMICGLWSQILYKEKINWYAGGLCGLGVFFGTVKF